MRPTGVAPGLDQPDPPDRVEILHESAHTRVTRLHLADRSLICKEPLGPDAAHSRRQELGILARLRALDGVAQLADGPPLVPGAILLVDAGPANLAVAPAPLAVDRVIDLALALAGAVAGMHHRGVLHRDISPANIVLGTDGAPCLVDFALATTVGQLRPEFTHHTQIVGTLAYLAPEATGRTGRPVDQRADLYALGATLYQLATGAPPFGAGESLQLIHDHMARMPVPPEQLNPAVPRQLSAIILHLLEKEPDNRYQTAAGLCYDVERLCEARASRAAAADGRVGEHDLPQALLPPSRLIGRGDEVAALRAAFDEAVLGNCRGVLVSGTAGMGKTALVDRLRQVVTDRDGWFATGKFDQYRRDLEFDGVYQGFRALGRLLLAEPEDALVRVRTRILTALGPNAGLATAVLPEFAALLAVPPDPGDRLTAQLRVQRNSLEILRAVASPRRPVVFFVDDLQWAGRTPMGLFDLILGEEPIAGLLLVGAYREDDVDAGRPLAALLARPGAAAGFRRLPLGPLPAAASVTMVAEMLRADRADRADRPRGRAGRGPGALCIRQPLSDRGIARHLRRDGLLTATATAGWGWDLAAVRRHVGDAGGGIVGATSALPAPSRLIVEAMACLGGRAEVVLLQTATGGSAGGVADALAPALEEGLLVTEPGRHEAVRFRHDSLREAVVTRLEPPRRRELHLAMARRLARVPHLFAVAAEQYLPVADAVDDADERRQVVGLLRRAADQAALIGNYVLVNRLLEAALPLIDHGENSTRAAVHTGRQAALYSLGRLEDADEQYRALERLDGSALDRTEATCVQVRSLTQRGRFADAVALGIESLRGLDLTVPAPDRLAADLDRQFDHLYHWLDSSDAAGDLVRPELAEPRMLAVTRLINAVMAAAYLVGDIPTFAWLSLEAVRIWLEHGPGRTVLGPASHGAFAAVAVRGDHAAGYRAARRILAFGEARGYEPETSHARFVFALLCWSFEPIEHGVQAARRAREGLIAGGDLANAGYSFHLVVPDLVDCASSLDEVVAEMDAGLAFARRTGNEHAGLLVDSYRWLASVLSGENATAAREPILGEEHDQPIALANAHMTRAIAAAIFGDPVRLDRHTAAVMPLLKTSAGAYFNAASRTLRALALAWRAQSVTDDDQRITLVAEVDELTRWLAGRAADAPDNFVHLVRLLEAERAWAVGDVRSAALTFDAARRAVSDRRRPWHSALITERTARFFLAQRLEQTGYDLLDRARLEYAAWGAMAKVAALDWAYPTQRSVADGAAAVPRPAPVTTGTIDLIGILSASQALSSETSIGRLHARVVDVLGAMTGATRVHLLVWSRDHQDWLLPTASGAMVPLDTGERSDAAPTSVLRYVRRTGEPLVLADATSDDRFARDPYLGGVDCCSLLAVPVLSAGRLRAVLLLENRLLRGAFTTDRLDAATLIAGQLAVSLDNAQLYAELAASRARIVAAGDAARRRIERDLHDGAQQRLVSLALRVKGSVMASVPPDAGELTAHLDGVAAELAAVLEELREIARGLHPAALADGGLGPALRTLARRSAVPVRLDARIGRRLPEQVELAAYYSVTEALTNAAKHAAAGVVDVHVEDSDGRLQIRVRDDGRGGADLSRGSGLVGMKDRIEALGGGLSVHSPVGSGTTVTIVLPLPLPTLPGPR